MVYGAAGTGVLLNVNCRARGFSFIFNGALMKNAIDDTPDFLVRIAFFAALYEHFNHRMVIELN
jgi:hypothetical protein